MRKMSGKALALALGIGLTLAGAAFSVLARNAQASSSGQGAGQAVSQDSLDYIRGRPLTEEERQEQEDLVPQLHELPAPDETAEPVTASQGRARALSLDTFDLREQGLVTSVKNQLVDGSCWAFATAAVAESAMMSKGLDNNPDLSEEHLAYFFYNRVDDPLGNTPSDKNIAADAGYTYKNIGGNLQLAGKFLSTWSGMAKEEVAPYSDKISVLDNSLAYESEAHLMGAYFIDPEVEQIKEAIYSFRQPVGITYYHASIYWNTDTAAYCCPITTSINHAVTIVGWDDNYKKENFSSYSNVQQDGAWIVKNSWGDASGDEGYIYISYEDQSIQGAVSMAFESADNYDHNYQYDGSSGSSSVSVPAGASYANVFQADGNPSGSEKLEAVGILLSSADVDLSIDVYTDLSDPADPSSGEHALSSQEAHTTYSGYTTFPLEKSISLQEKSYFSVIFTNRSSEEKKFSIESSVDSGWIVFEAGVESGESFYRAGEGEAWKDMDGSYLSSRKSVNARIKAYTSDSDDILPDPTQVPDEVPTPIGGATPSAEPTPSVEATPGTGPTPTGGATPGAEPTPTGGATPSISPTLSVEPTPATNPSPGAVVIRKTASAAGKITLKWKSAANASSYQVYRAAASGTGWRLLGTTPKTSYADQTVQPATAYRYRVRAVNGKGQNARYGIYSSIRKVLSKPAAPTKISIQRTTKASKNTKAVLTFRASKRVSGYLIRQYNRSTGKYQAAYKIKGLKVYRYDRTQKKYIRIGTAKKSAGKITCTLNKIDLKTYRRQFYKMQAYVKKSGYGTAYSKYSSKKTVNR